MVGMLLKIKEEERGPVCIPQMSKTNAFFLIGSGYLLNLHWPGPLVYT